MNDRISVAVIIPSFNGAHKVLNVLKALERQSFKDFRTILVIDGSTDRTDKLIERFKPLLHLTVINQKNKGRAGARNAGATASTEELIVFLDDDMRPEINCIERHVNHYINYPQTALAGSQKEDPNKAKTDFQRYKAYRSNQWMDTLGYGLLKMNENNLFFSSANCSLPRKLFEKEGGFNESLQDGEDFDFSSRLFKKGVPIYFDGECLGWHDDYITIAKYIQRQREYRKAWLHLISLRPELIYEFNRFTPDMPKGLKKLFFKIYAFSIWVKVVDRSKILLFLPKLFRYKIYDYIIASLGRYNIDVPIK